MEQLRAERLQRESSERKRTEQLLNGETSKTSGTGDIDKSKSR